METLEIDDEELIKLWMLKLMIRIEVMDVVSDDGVDEPRMFKTYTPDIKTQHQLTPQTTAHTPML